jgi:hypothetical protein
MATKIDLDGKNRDAPTPPAMLATVTTLIYAAMGFFVGLLLTWLAWGCRLLGENGIVPTCATGGVVFAMLGVLVGVAVGARHTRSG